MYQRDLKFGVPFSLHGLPTPFQRRFPALPCGVMAGYPMQTVIRFSRSDGGKSGNKKSPQNKPNRTTPSGEALIQVCYVAIRKLKTALAVLSAERNHLRIMLYSIVGIDYHKIRAASTKTFSKVAVSAECRKTDQKLWWKDRELDESGSLDKVKRSKRCCGRSRNIHHWFLCKPEPGGQKRSDTTPARSSFCHKNEARQISSSPFSASAGTKV